MHPWKRNGPCSGDRTRRADFYLHDAANCNREEYLEDLKVGLTWEIFKEFRLSTLFHWKQTHAREEEFANLKRGFLVNVSWQTGKTTLTDPLRTFLPWAYEGHLL